MKIKFALGAIMLFMLGTGCSVYMAAKQPDKKDVSVFNTGTPRPYVIAECGQPEYTTQNEDGSKTDIFVFVQGYSSGAKAGRAFVHGAADFFTLGLWEVIGTPIEAVADGTEVKVQVDYDVNDRVKHIQALEGEEQLASVDSNKGQIVSQSSDTQPVNLSEMTGGTKEASFLTAKMDSTEPWTGTWNVEGSRMIGGIWGMKQSGRIVKSTGASYYEFEGEVSGNKLEGKIKGDYGLTRNFDINISSDGLTFEGKSGTHHLKGKRKLENMAVITPVKLNIFAPWTGTWEVESSGPYGAGVWDLEQQGKIVTSTKYSSFDEFNGNVNGNQLKGKIIRSSMIYPFAIKISQDGLSFEGTLVGHANKTEWLKGKRKK
jgi:hypothetical protein